MKEAIAFVKWMRDLNIIPYFDTALWHRVTCDPKDWPEDFRPISDEELWNKFKKNERKT